MSNELLRTWSEIIKVKKVQTNKKKLRVTVRAKLLIGGTVSVQNCRLYDTQVDTINNSLVRLVKKTPCFQWLKLNFEKIDNETYRSFSSVRIVPGHQYQ